VRSRLPRTSQVPITPSPSSRAAYARRRGEQAEHTADERPAAGDHPPSLFVA